MVVLRPESSEGRAKLAPPLWRGLVLLLGRSWGSAASQDLMWFCPPGWDCHMYLGESRLIVIGDVGLTRMKLTSAFCSLASLPSSPVMLGLGRRGKPWRCHHHRHGTGTAPALHQPLTGHTAPPACWDSVERNLLLEAQTLGACSSAKRRARVLFWWPSQAAILRREVKRVTRSGVKQAHAVYVAPNTNLSPPPCAGGARRSPVLPAHHPAAGLPVPFQQPLPCRAPQKGLGH